MHRMRTFAAGLAVVVSLGAAATALAPVAFASAARPAGTGSFQGWRAAQQAAGFSLLRPGRTDRLGRAGAVISDRCQAYGQLSNRDVLADYGSFLRRLLAIEPNNSGGPRGTFGAAP